MIIGDVCIMTFYGLPESIIFTNSKKIITTALLRYSFSVPPESKNN